MVPRGYWFLWLLVLCGYWFSGYWSPVVIGFLWLLVPLVIGPLWLLVLWLLVSCSYRFPVVPCGYRRPVPVPGIAARHASNTPSVLRALRTRGMRSASGQGRGGLESRRFKPGQAEITGVARCSEMSWHVGRPSRKGLPSL